MQSTIKKLILIVFIVLPCYYINGQSSEKKKPNTEKELEKINQKKEEAFIKHQYSIQTKEVQKRMKRSERMTEKYYQRQMGKTWWQRFCNFFKKNRYERKRSYKSH
jgi:hypothetical protein